MKKTAIALLIAFTSFPVMAEDTVPAKVRLERPFSIGITGGLVPFAGIYGDYALSETNSIGLNLSSTIIYNTVQGHYRHYFSDPESYQTDFYMESRLGFGQSTNLGYSPAKLTINGSHYIGFDARADWGLVFNTVIGVNLFVNSDLSGLLALSSEIGLGYGF